MLYLVIKDQVWETNFSLACPYMILVHFAELEWAAEYGVEEGLVRISAGTENTNILLRSL